MKKVKLTKTLALLSLSVLTLTSCGEESYEWANGLSWVSEHAEEEAYNALASEKRSSTYRTIESYFPDDWNSARTFNKENGCMITNVVDGLLAVDEYNHLIPELATEVPSKSNGRIKEVDGHYEITFKIRDGANWYTNTNKNSEVKEKVKASDFVTALEFNLDAANSTESYYMPMMFIEGAEEYYNFSMYRYYSESGFGTVSKTKLDAISNKPESERTEAEKTALSSCSAGRLATPSGVCKDVIDPLPNKATDETAYNTWISGLLGVEVADVPNIDNFSRVGVKANKANDEVTYTLTGKQEYFLSVTTYTPFLPVPTEFFTANKETYGSSDPRSILSCGAYVVDSGYSATESTELIFHKAENYYDKNSVKNQRVIVKQSPTDSTSSTGRELFERGEIDGFTVQKGDAAGWKKYVTGNKGTGTINEPANELAFSNESYGDGSSFAYMLNTNRTTYKNSMMDSSAQSHVKGFTGGNSLELVTYFDNQVPAAIKNTNIALTFSSKLRQAILMSIDYSVYFKNRVLANDSYEDRKQAINTWTPHHFITTTGSEKATNGGNDYVDFLKDAYIDGVLLADERETSEKTISELVKGSDAEKAYAATLQAAANDALGSSSFGGMSLISEYKDGKFTGFKKAAEGTNYEVAAGQSTNGTGATISNSSVEGVNETWYESSSRDSATISKLIEEGIAEAELNYKTLTGEEYKIATPILVEYPTLEYNDEMNREAAATLNQANASLNGGKYVTPDENRIEEQNGMYGIGEEVFEDSSKTISIDNAKVLLLHSTKKNIPEGKDYNQVAGTYNYSMVISGWGPDYSDAKTYADTLKFNGDMQGAIGTGATGDKHDDAVKQFVTNGYDELVAKADLEETDVNRAKAYAKAEIQMLYGNYLIRPVYMAGQGINVSVRKTLPKGVTSMSWGLSSYKYKGIEVMGKTVKGETLRAILDQLKEVRAK